MEEKKPKKRGRKPKKDNGKKEGEHPKINDNLIIKLNPINDYQEVVEPFSIDTKEVESTIKEMTNRSEVCWNCCHNFDWV